MPGSIGRAPNWLREIDLHPYFSFRMRITGGVHRSRPLRAPRGNATRPTSDRVREALFAILASSDVELAGARVLDLYAGTGALALEALSRGAAHATLVERAKDALAAIRANVAALGCESRVSIVAAPVERASKLVDAPFDVVFADPPYADVESGVAIAAIAQMVAAGVLADKAVLALEHAAGRAGKRKPEAPAIAGLAPTTTRSYGDTAISFYCLGAP
jgi:16S rRNA (guanine966-N2)-methyltransferase